MQYLLYCFCFCLSYTIGKIIMNTVFCALCIDGTLCIGLVQSSTCSRSLPTYNESDFTGGDFTSAAGGIQLLIPSWNFTCTGVITEWLAHVTGNTSVGGLVEFQIFEPVTDDENGLYRLSYGNDYNGDSAEGSLITRPVGVVMPQLIPIRPGYIVGVYLPPSTVELGLLYETNGDTDVYYWENVESRTCNFSLCSGKVKRDVELLIGWEFSELSKIEAN